MFEANFRVYGVRKVWLQLQGREGFDVARRTVARLMRAMGLEGIIRGKPIRTTVSDKGGAMPSPITLIASSMPWRRTCYGTPTSPTSRPGPASSMSPLSSTPMPAGIVGWRVSRTAHASFVLDALEQALHDRRPVQGSRLVHHSDRGSQGGSKWVAATPDGSAMSIRKRRSDRSGRVRLFSPGRPPVAGREERRRFWAAIAAGAASEDAAVGVGVPQAVGTRWFRKAGGMPPSIFGPSAKPLSGRYLSFAEREEIALLRVQGYSMVARSLVGSGGWHRQSPPRSCGATPPPEAAASRIVRRQRNGTPSARLAAQSRRSLRATRR